MNGDSEELLIGNTEFRTVIEKGRDMNEVQNELNYRLEELCSWMYEGDKRKMLLDLLVVIGYWSECLS